MAMDAFERMSVVVGDITTLKVDAIVNAANSGLLGGGGVDGAIHRAAGPRLRAHNQTLGGCPTGDAKITPSFELQSNGVRYLIHTVGPIWNTDPRADGTEKIGYRQEDIDLARCYLACLDLAESHHVTSLAIPCISTGVYGFPKTRAAEIAVMHTKSRLERNEWPQKVVFCCFTEADAEAYRRLLIPRTDILTSIRGPADD